MRERRTTAIILMFATFLHQATSSPSVVSASLRSALNASVISSEMVIIASSQRSGSTELCSSIAAHPCVLGFNEFFNNGRPGQEQRQSGRAYEFLGSPQAFAERGLRGNVLRSLRTVRAKACQAIDAQHAASNEPLCGPRCAVVFKLFQGHLEHAGAMQLLHHPNATVVVLERSTDDIWCSLTHARAHGDWGTHPTLGHRMNHHSAGCANKTAPKAAFEQKHRGWYAFVRSEEKGRPPASAQHQQWWRQQKQKQEAGPSQHSAADAAVAAAPSLRLEVPFGVWTNPHRSMSVLQSIWAAAGLSAYAPTEGDTAANI